MVSSQAARKPAVASKSKVFVKVTVNLLKCCRFNLQMITASVNRFGSARDRP